MGRAKAASPAKRKRTAAKERAAPAPRAKKKLTGGRRAKAAARPEVRTKSRPRTRTRRTVRAVAPGLASADAGLAPNVEPLETRGKYVYCVIRAGGPLAFGPIGIGARRPVVHTVNFRDLAAVVSDTPIEVYDPTRENVLVHEEVNETVMRKHTVIPMSFGTVFKTRDDIVELLRSAYDAFLGVLNKMQDKLEFGLKVLWDRDDMIRAIESDDDDVRRLKSEISSQKGSTYFARMQYGRLLDAEIEARSERYVTEIFDALRDVAVASRTNRPIGDKMIMNAAFLVSREFETAFDQRVKEVGARLDKLTFKYTGPWPPYNFVNIRLKLERVRD